MEKTIICIGREYGAVDMPSDRFWQNAPDMNSMTKTVSSQSQRNAASKVKSKNIWKSSR